MKCPRCQHDGRRSAKFCEECGTPLALPKEGGPLASSYEELQHALTEALDQQRAAGEVLNVIGQATTNLLPVFDAIVRSASQLCDGQWAAAVRFDGELIHLVAQYNRHPDSPDLGIVFPYRPGRRFPAGRAVAEGRVVHIPDAEKDPDLAPEVARRARSFLVVPMLRAGAPIGAIAVARPAPGPFPPSQIELLRTFAGQAVIALENARLFTDLQAQNANLTEALEQQTATSEILRVIASSPTDLQLVLDAMAESAGRLCGAYDAVILRMEGDILRVVAHDGPIPGARGLSLPVVRGTVGGRTVLDRTTVHVADLQAEVAEFPEGSTIAREQGHRTILSVPLLREGAAIGAIHLRRTEVQPFTDKEIALLKTFADQAVIAIENVRLFSELQEKNRALTTAHAQVTEALEQQTATSEILQTITHAQTDVHPVFDTIVASATRLCKGRFGVLNRFDGRLIHLAAHYNLPPEAVDALKGMSPRPIDEGSFSTLALKDGRIHQISDIEAEASAPAVSRRMARMLGFRSQIVVPLLRGGSPVGTLNITRLEPGLFSESQVELLKTFADQAVIAIENVRLFKELEAANRELAAASQHKSEFLANMSHELRTPLNAIIGFSEVLGERLFGELNEKQEEYLKDIHASGQHLLSLINDILDLSKIEAGRMELELTDFHLPTALDNALTLVRERAGRRGIALRLTTDEQLNYVRADERKVRQVVLNLLSNAVKFTPEDGRIEVRAKTVDGSIEVSVRDTGVGIAPEDQEAIFEEFRQVGTVDKKVEGTGLGLALSRRFIELHGGRIWVESQPGVGSTFTFTLPMRPEV